MNHTFLFDGSARCFIRVPRYCGGWYLSLSRDAKRRRQSVSRLAHRLASAELCHRRQLDANTAGK